MMRRRALMMLGGGLPGAYRRVEYLESDGSQYIDLDTSITSGMDIFATVSCTFSGTNRNVACFGGRTSGTESNVQFNLSTKGKYVFDYGSYEINRIQFDKVLNIFFDVYFHNNVISVNGKSNTITPVSPFATPKTYLFDCYNKFSGSGWIGRISRFTLGNVRNLIPCVRKVDNKPGMYDTVSKIFFTNAGTGEFIVPN